MNSLGRLLSTGTPIIGIPNHLSAQSLGERKDRMHGLEEAMHAREAYEAGRKQTTLASRARHLCKLQEA